MFLQALCDSLRFGFGLFAQTNLALHPDAPPDQQCNDECHQHRCQHGLAHDRARIQSGFVFHVEPALLDAHVLVRINRSQGLVDQVPQGGLALVHHELQLCRRHGVASGNLEVAQSVLADQPGHHRQRRYSGICLTVGDTFQSLQSACQEKNLGARHLIEQLGTVSVPGEQRQRAPCQIVCGEHPFF